MTTSGLKLSSDKHQQRLGSIPGDVELHGKRSLSKHLARQQGISGIVLHKQHFDPYACVSVVRLLLPPSGFIAAAAVVLHKNRSERYASYTGRQMPRLSGMHGDSVRPVLVELGRDLSFDAQFSVENVSGATCHPPDYALAGGEPLRSPSRASRCDGARAR